ncbi:MAG: sulfatase-like hydrolase/transferase [Planctomycetota bacterium]|nr:sulfatase-like hydrolase/transferase [Planctomycetota bacterium]
MLTILLGLLPVPAPADLAPPASPPNVVLIISDDQWWGDFGFMGSEDVRTPHLDALAAESRVFPRGYVPTALCRASLATLITGLHPHEHKLTGNDPPRGVERARMLEHIEAVETVADHLGAAGYRSLQTGKWWEGNCACGGFTEGMTHGDPSRGGRHGDEGLRIGRDGMAPATDFIDACVEDETPFFLWYAPLLPHTPHDPPERLLETYRVEGVPVSVARYRAMCTLFDETCGELLGHLRERGVAEDTLVLFVVDNGWIQRPDGRGYAPRSKRTPYEGGVRTPIMVRWVGRVAPGRVETPVSSVDVPATILTACGVDVPARWPGVDLMGDVADRGPLFGAAYTHDVVEVGRPERSLLSRWVLEDPLKLIVHTDPARPAELFDVRADPAEERPLEDPETAAKLRARLDAWWPAGAAAKGPQRRR